MARKYREIGKAGWGYTAITTCCRLHLFLPGPLDHPDGVQDKRTDALAVPPKLFFTPTLENFTSVFYRASITTGPVRPPTWGLYFFNSIFIAGTSVSLAIIVGTLAAYGFSRFPLRGNDTYLFIILTTRMMPPIVVIIPIFLMFRLTGLAGSYWGIIFLYTAFNIPFSVWLVKSFFDELNPEIEDAARMDGASERRVFFRFCIPQILAGLAATFVFGLILTWNEFLFALLLTGVETRTVPVAMARTLGGEVGVDYGLSGSHRDAVPDPDLLRDLPVAEPASARRDLRDGEEMTIELKKLTKRFGTLTAVDAIDLEVGDGEVLCLLGPSGCGKTTTLRMVAGLEFATEGDVILGGKRVNDLAPRERNVAMSFQFYALYPVADGGRKPGLSASRRKPVEGRDRHPGQAHRRHPATPRHPEPDARPAGRGRETARCRGPIDHPRSGTASCSTNRSRVSTCSCARKCGARSRRCCRTSPAPP